MIRPRDDVALMPGYHSPQLDVTVRLNTNEAPDEPPAEWVRELARAVESVEWHRYPDRAAIRLRAAIGALHGVGPEQVFAANGSNEVLQTVLLTYGGPGRTAAVWEPTYALHSHIARLTGTAVAEGERAADFSIDLDEVRRVVARAEPSVAFLCSPNNPTGMVDDEATVRATLELVASRRRPARGRRGLRSVRAVVGARTGRRRRAARGESHLLQDLVDGRHPPRLPGRSGRRSWPSWRRSSCRTTSTRSSRWPGCLALDHVADMDARVARLVEERGRLVARLAELPVDVWPSGANFVLFRPHDIDGSTVWQQLVDRSILVRNCSSWPRLEGCLRVTIGTPTEDDAFLAALEDILS